MPEPAGNEGIPTPTPDADWRTQLPEDMREAPVFKDINDLPTLAKNYQELKTYQGNSLRIPGEDASEEDIQAFHQKLMDRVPGLMHSPDVDDPEQLESVYTRLGRPEAADGYKVPEIDTGGIEMDMSMADALKPVAHKYGLNQKQFEGIVRDMTLGNAEMARQFQNEHATAISNLSKEWGAAYNERVTKALRVAEATGAPNELVEAGKKGLLGANTLKWLYSLSESLGGEVANIVKQKGAPIMTPDEAQLKISEIRNNRKHPYWNANDPAHDAARKRMRDLHKLAFPGNDMNQGLHAAAGGEVRYQ